MTSQFQLMASQTQFHYFIQIILQMQSCDYSLVDLAFTEGKFSQPKFYKDLTRKTSFLEEWSWFKFNNLGLAIVTILKFYTIVSKGLKLKDRKFLGLLLVFAKETRKKMVRGGGGFLFASPNPEQGFRGLKLHNIQLMLLGILVQSELNNVKIQKRN